MAARLVRDGRTVLDVPPELPARARAFVAGQGRQKDVADALWIALVGHPLQSAGEGVLVGNLISGPSRRPGSATRSNETDQPSSK